MLLYGLIFAIMNTGLTIMTKNKWVVLIQLALVIGFPFSEAIPVLLTTLLVAQIVFLIYMFYRLVKALDYNYHLVMEKTHQFPPYYTKGNQSGRLKHFL